MDVGSEKFEALVGELKLASQMQSDTELHSHEAVQVLIYVYMYKE
jgi:hypothetical protein